MVPPADKHLLEAFQEMGGVKKPAPPAPPAPQARPAPAPPAAAPARAAAPAAAPAAPRAQRAPSAQPGASSHGSAVATTSAAGSTGAGGRLLALGLAFALGIATGHYVPQLFDSTARASGSNGTPGIAGNAGGAPGAVPRVEGAQSTPAQKGAAAQAPAPKAAASAESWPGDTLLATPANRWTVLAITYSNSPGNEELARDTAAWMKSQGLPVARPVVHARTIAVLVGAAPTSGQLFALQNQIRALSGPTGRAGEFSTAYPVEIDSQIQR